MRLIIDHLRRRLANVRRSEIDPIGAVHTARHRSWFHAPTISLTAILVMLVIGPTTLHAQPTPASCAEAQMDCSLDVRRITIGSETFDIPVSHFDIVPPIEHQTQSVLLFLSWPDLSWDSREEMLATLMVAGSAERINLLIYENTQHEGALWRVFDFLTTRYGPPYLEPAGRYRGLSRYLQLEGRRTSQTQEMYVWPHSDEILSLIRCVPADAPSYSSIVNPSCVHTYYIGDLGFKLTYQRPLLSQWTEIEYSVRNLFSEYSVDRPPPERQTELEE